MLSLVLKLKTEKRYSRKSKPNHSSPAHVIELFSSISQYFPYAAHGVVTIAIVVAAGFKSRGRAVPAFVTQGSAALPVWLARKRHLKCLYQALAALGGLTRWSRESDWADMLPQGWEGREVTTQSSMLYEVATPPGVAGTPWSWPQHLGQSPRRQQMF